MAQRYLLKESRYIRQAGQDHPSYVYADPDHPQVITLPDDTQPDKRLVPLADTEEAPLLPEKRVPAFGVVEKDPVPKAANIQGPVQQPAKTKRLADA